MEPGELEHRKAFEETATHNIKTVVTYTTETRALIRDLEKEVKQLKNMMVLRDTEVAELRKQVSLIQAGMYAAGTE